ncbi:MAG: hypothetical protein ACE141_10875 [Bryobacteraceae bacterium]
MVSRATTAFLLAGLAAAQCATMEYLSPDAMIDQSTAIVRAVVLDSDGRQHGPMVYTHFKLKILEQLKGAAPLEIVVPGGTAGSLRQTFAGAPALVKGSEYLLFLWTGSSGLTHVLGFAQGVYRVSVGAGGEMTAARPASAEVMLDPKTGMQMQDEPVQLRLADLRSRVASRASAKGRAQ